MDKARITVRLSEDRPRLSRADVPGETAPSRPAGSASADRPSRPEALKTGSFHHNLQPRADRPALRASKGIPPRRGWPAGLRYLVKHWLLPATIALTVGTLLGGICFSVFTRSGPPSPDSNATSNIHLYTIQVGAFSDGARAQALAASLEKRGITAKLSGGRPTLVLVGVTIDPAVPGPFGDMLRNMNVPMAVKLYRPPAPPGQIQGVSDSKAVVQALEKSVDLLGIGVDEWSKGGADAQGQANLNRGLQEVSPVLDRGAQELRAAGRKSQADRLEKWKEDLSAVVGGIRSGEAPGPLMGTFLQAMDDYEQLIADLSAGKAPGPAAGG
ncbi:SPOR domain-containing protein [Kyrpidia spormannii]|uniref:SPOR domain-containing protein n=1 Tax=Kyrpidia spormannii TaxID=2055160 RepID=UPI0012FFE1C8|nr:SPOR domain-containing protein [Kyrpidia spormannii]